VTRTTLSERETSWSVPHLKTVPDYLDYWADVQPEKCLYSFLDIDGAEQESYTYGQFRDRSLQLAAYLSATVGLRHGSRVLLVYPPGLELIAASFACMRAGVIPVPLYPPSPLNFEGGLAKMAFIARDCEACAALTTRAFLQSYQTLQSERRLRSALRDGPGLANIEWITTDDAPTQTSISLSRDLQSIAFLQYTSGSTSDPKGVIVTHRNLIRNSAAVLDHRPTTVTWLPQYHDMGFIGYYLYPVITGGSTYGFSPMNFLKRPALWLETITRVRGTITSAPNFAYEYCLREDKIPSEILRSFDLSSLRVMMNAAEPVRADTFVGFLERFSESGLRAGSLMAAYGLAENTLAVSSYGKKVLTINKKQLQQRVLHIESEEGRNNNQLRVVSCGRPLDGNVVRIVDPDSHIAQGENQIGEIWVDGVSKCAGYWKRPELALEVFHATLNHGSDDERTYLRTGDLGFLHEGELYICGRTKDLIIIRGVNYYPHDIEAIVEASSSDIRQGCVAAFSVEEESEALVVVVEGKRKRSLPDFKAIAGEIRKQYYIEPDKIVCTAPRSIPKTTSGKLSRSQCRQLWLDGELPVVALHEKALEVPDSGSDLMDRFRYLADLYNLSASEQHTFAEIGMDSITMVEFVSKVKELLEEYGASKLAKGVDLRLLQRLTIAEFYSFLERFERQPERAIPILQRRLEENRDEQRAYERTCMHSDAKLALPEILPDKDDRPVTDILMTGGTGFFGPFLLSSLLRETSYTIHLLIRGTDADHAMERLRASLRRVDLWTPALEEQMQTRVRAVCGDLSRPGLGLEPHRWELLSREVQAICHSGAMVNYVLDYEALKPHNVDGTRELLRLAATGCRKIFHLISSTFIFGWTTKATLWETDNNDDMSSLDFGYAQTKWVAEQLVLSAQRQGLDTCIYRPSLISASTGHFGSRDDIAVRLLAFMIRHGVGVNALNQISFLPADIVAHNIVSILEDPRANGSTFHITADKYYNFKDITDLISHLFGYSFRYHDIPEFIEQMNQRCTRHDPVYPLLDFFNQYYEKIAAMQLKRYNNDRYREARKQSGREIAEPSLAETVSLIVDSMLRQGLITEPPTRPNVGKRFAHSLPPAGAPG